MKTMKEYKAIRVIISGGGTGGHIFPAVSIANKLRELNPETEILFVGANGRMEMEKVPAAGYKIIGLDIAGLQRKLTLSNLALPFKLFASVRKAKKIVREFKPDVAVGVGGYASAPLMMAAVGEHVPSLLQEQNGFAGLTNRINASQVDRICVAYEGMEKFFPADKIVLTGNPIRSEMVPATPQTRLQGMEFYGLDPKLRHILVVGGSLGCRTLNEAMKGWIASGCPGGEDVEVIWQCGKYYKQSVDAFMKEMADSGNDLSRIHYNDFISRMDLAYATSDIVISRSGASSVSEICATVKAAIFVPSPNVAEDHQTHNAMALVSKGAAMIVKDDKAQEELMPLAMNLVHDQERIDAIQAAVEPLAKRNAAQEIVDEIYKLVR